MKTTFLLIHQIKSILAFSIFILFLFTCTPPPVETAAPTQPVSPLAVQTVGPVASFINVPLRLRTRVVEEMLNQQVDGLLYENDTLSFGVVKPVGIKVWKQDSIRITLQGDELRYKVPLKVTLRFSFTIGAFGVSHTEYQDAEASIALNFSSRVFIKNDWKVVTMTEPQGYEWLSDPVIKVRFLTIPVKPVADLLLSNQQKTLSTMIDNEINTVFNVKKMLLPLWSQLQDPILLSQDPRVWLRLTPQAVYMTQLEGRDGKIMSSVGIKSVAETFFADQPQCPKKDSLPDFVIPGRVDSSFVVNLYSEMNYDAASAFLRGYLLGRNFSFGRKEVVVQDVSITGMKGYALIALDFVGSYRGKVYVFGRPVFDTATATVSIEDLELDLSTQNVGHKAADWLFHGIILSKVKPFLKFSLREKMLESQLMVQKMLCHSELAKNVFITGSIDSLKVGGVELTDKAIRAVVYAKGSLLLTIHD